MSATKACPIASVDIAASTRTALDALIDQAFGIADRDGLHAGALSIATFLDQELSRGHSGIALEVLKPGTDPVVYRDDGARVTVTYLTPPSQAHQILTLPLSEVHTLCVDGFRIVNIERPNRQALWFAGWGRAIQADGYYATGLVDNRGLGMAIYDPEEGGRLLATIRATINSNPGAKERTRGARREVRAQGSDPDNIEQLAAAGYIFRPKPDSGLPQAEAHVLQVIGDQTEVLASTGEWGDPAHRRFSMLATTVDAELSTEAWGATRPEYLKGHQHLAGLGARPWLIDPQATGYRGQHRVMGLSDPTASRALTKLEAHQRVKAAGLTGRQLHVWLLAFDHHQAEIAEMLGVSRSTVAGTLSAARKKLRVA